MAFDAYAALARIQAGGGDYTANAAKTAKQGSKSGVGLAKLAALAASTASNYENATALEMALDAAQERAAIMEYDGGLTRPEAEHAAATAAARAWGVPVAAILQGL